MRIDASRTRNAIDAINSELIHGKLPAFSGRELRELEGRALLGFPDAWHAVAFGVGIQQALKARNRDQREDRRIQLRMGIDVVSGDGGPQAVAATEKTANGLTELAEPGGICISGAAKELAASEIELPAEQIGNAALDSVPRSVAVFDIKYDDKTRVLSRQKQPVTRKAGRRTALAITCTVAALLIVAATGLFYFGADRSGQTVNASDVPEFSRPSIAVLPFENVTLGNEGAMFAHGITVSIISALSEVPQIAVISANSAFALAQEFEGPSAAGEELGVRYVLSGTVQTQDNRVRVIAELSDLDSGESLWSERFERDQEDLFAVQDEISLRVLVSLQLTLTNDMEAANKGNSTTHVGAYLGLMKAEKAFRNYTKDSMIETRRLLSQVREIDPNYYQALLLEARSHTFDAQWGYSENALDSLQAATDLLKEASQLDGSMSANESAEIQIAQAYIDQIAGRYDSALSLAHEAANASPNNSHLLATAGWISSFDRELERAISLLRSAVSLNPVYPSWYASFIARSYAFKGMHDAAIRWAQQGVSRSENSQRLGWTLLNLAFVYVEAGKTGKAKEAGSEALAAWPGVTMETLKRAQPFRYDEDWDRFASAMKTAGVLD